MEIETHPSARTLFCAWLLDIFVRKKIYAELNVAGNTISCKVAACPYEPVSKPHCLLAAYYIGFGETSAVVNIDGGRITCLVCYYRQIAALSIPFNACCNNIISCRKGNRECRCYGSISCNFSPLLNFPEHAPISRLDIRICCEFACANS